MAAAGGAGGAGGPLSPRDKLPHTLGDYFLTNEKLFKELTEFKDEMSRRHEILKEYTRNYINDIEVLTLNAHGSIKVASNFKKIDVKLDDNKTGINIINITKIGELLNSYIAMFLNFGLNNEIMKELKRLFYKNYYKRFKEKIELEWILKSFYNISLKYNEIISKNREDENREDEVYKKLIDNIMNYIINKSANELYNLDKEEDPVRYNLDEPDIYYKRTLKDDLLNTEKIKNIDIDNEFNKKFFKIIIKNINFDIKIYRAYSEEAIPQYNLNFNFKDLNLKNKEILEFTGLLKKESPLFEIDIDNVKRSDGRLTESKYNTFIKEEDISLKNYLEQYNTEILSNKPLDESTDETGNKLIKFNTKIVILYICNYIGDITDADKKHVEEVISSTQNKYYLKYLKYKNKYLELKKLNN